MIEKVLFKKTGWKVDFLFCCYMFFNKYNLVEEFKEKKSFFSMSMLEKPKIFCHISCLIKFSSV